MKILKIFFLNFFVLVLSIFFIELIFGYWFKDENFGIYMRKERKINWHTSSTFNEKYYNFYYRRNFWGFRGAEFDPSDVKIIFEGGSTGNQRFTPENLTIVGLLNEEFRKKNFDIKIYNASTDGKSLNGFINDFNFWFNKIPKLNLKYVIFLIGINDRFENFDGQKYLDYKISEKKIDRLKDYIKNNSFFADKFYQIKNRYFPKKTFMYDLNRTSLYENFDYIDYKTASNRYLEKDIKNQALIKKFSSKLNILNKIIKENNIKPIFITQLMYDGLSDKNLFLVNNQLKKFALENDYFTIPLDEILIMEKNDFYDTVHTTPEGSKKIANKIFPLLLEYFSQNDELN